jgi:hypothetical protein
VDLSVDTSVSEKHTDSHKANVDMLLKYVVLNLPVFVKTRGNVLFIKFSHSFDTHNYTRNYTFYGLLVTPVRVTLTTRVLGRRQLWLRLWQTRTDPDWPVWRTSVSFFCGRKTPEINSVEFYIFTLVTDFNCCMPVCDWSRKIELGLWHPQKIRTESAV